jgi:N utilization substance protein B
MKAEDFLKDISHFLFPIYHSRMPSRRRLARIAAMQTVFQMEARPSEAEQCLAKNIEELGGAEKVDADFSKSLVAGVEQKKDDIRKGIEDKAPQWTWDRMDAITRSILLVGGYELLFKGDAPPAVVMNEAIDIAKEYGTAEGAKFVNGVLNALANGKGG